MNALVDQFGDALAVVAVPCNQFGHQNWHGDDELLNSLRHVRPGKGFEPKFLLTSKVDVNGTNTHPLFDFLKKALPTPVGPADKDADILANNVASIVWSPVRRSDISWSY
mmetsp:Transcript_15048/g.35474  ORF Transcript_15048/g.35474 Transcript_15048/m.35474 type:complete len:110 (-) Transcript_15048:5-334(-)